MPSFSLFCGHYKHDSSVFQQGTLFFKGAIFFYTVRLRQVILSLKSVLKKEYMSI